MKIKNNKLAELVSSIKLTAKNFKKEPQDLTQTELLSETNIKEWELRKFGGFNKIKTTFFPFTEKEFTAQKQIKDVSSYVKTLESKLTNVEDFKERLEQILKTTPFPKFEPFKLSTKAPINRNVNLVLSDLHIGSDIKKEETGGLDFGKTEEARRLARIVKETIEYKPQYRDSTSLNVLLLGDIIQNSLHDPRDGAARAEQSARAIYLLSQAIAQLSISFPKINVYCTTGNHGRNMARHQQRAVNQKWDSDETIVYYSLKMILKDAKNVTFHIPKTPYLVYDVFGKKVFATHGDTVLNPGYPNKAIRTGPLEAQINKINATLPDTEEYSVIIVGHVHTGSVTHLANGSVLITNGPMVPSDEFAISIGLMENNCGQYLFESVKDYPVGDCRFIRVNKNDDKDSSLDKIIKKWNGFDD
jgi:predicted phosphodiesterase